MTTPLARPGGRLEAFRILGLPSDVMTTVLAIIAACAFAGGALRVLEAAFADTPSEVQASHRDVEIAADVTLAGTLSTPSAGSAANPLAILLSGAGAHDRRGELAGHERLTELSNALLEIGFATLRLDDRGVGNSGGDLMSSTLDDFAADVLAAARFASRETDIDASRIGVIGGSEGAMVAAKAAASAPDDISFVVLLSAPASHGVDLFVDQQVRILSWSTGAEPGSPEAQEARQLAERAADLASSTEPEDTSDPEIRAEAAAIAERLGELGPKRLSFSIDPQSQRERQVDLLLSPLMRSQLANEAANDLRRMTQPTLAIHGTLDRQIPVSELEIVEEALAASDAPKVETRTLDGLNHLLQPARTGLPDEYALIGVAWDPSALAVITSWLKDLWEPSGD